jgi:hypothetical protein
MAQVFTGKDIPYFMLAQLKAAFKLERAGLTHSSMKGKKLRPMYAEFLGLKPRDDYELYIHAVQVKMNAMLAAAEAQRTDSAPN